MLARAVALVAAVGLGIALSAGAVEPLGPAISAQTELGGEFPDNCVYPLGWLTPAGSTTGWSVDTSTAHSGVCSLRSNPMASSPSGFSNKARLQVTGQFTSSGLRFTRKVSSEQNWDCLRLFIDGAEKDIGSNCSQNGGLGASGEMDWTRYTFPVPDGQHTIVWSYEKDPSVSVGSDAAWIDDVEIIPIAPFPPSCVMPAGWVTPAGATAGWAVATDQAYEGTCSLKSSPIPNGGKAQIQLAAIFDEGTVSFARRVSSELSYDCLKFFIDGVEQNVGAACASNGGLGVSGVTSWGAVEIPITAGAHTLRWSYEKDSSLSAGSDAAWIDNVVLPANHRLPSAPYLDFVSRDTDGNATFSAFPPDDDGGSPITEYILTWRPQGDQTIEGQQSYFFSLPQTLHISGLQEHGAYIVSLRARNDFGDGPATEVNTGKDACFAPAEGYAVASSSFDANGGLTFAARPVNGSGSVVVSIQNKDGFPANVYLSIDSAGDFSSSDISNCEFIAAFDTCPVTINFSPVTSGTRTGSFSIDGPGKLRCTREPTKTLALTGAGIALNQTITFGPLANKTFGDAPFSVAATATSGLPVAFSSLTTPVCTVAASTVTIVAAGTCTLAANQAGSAEYNPAPQVTQSFTVAKASQVITFNTLSNRAVNQGAFAPSATASSGLAVAFSSTTPSICTVSAGSVSTIALGTCTIAANQAGNANYLAAPQVTSSFQVTAALTSQTITFNALANKALGDPAFTISATASSGLTVTFSSLTSPVCTVSGTSVSLVATGTCTIAANQAGNATYLPASQVTQSFTVAAPTNAPRLINLSTRGQVLGGDEVMIAGFVIEGSASKKVVIRAKGPSLTQYGVNNALPDPSLQLARITDSAVIATNDNFGTAANLAELQATGLAPDNALDSAILVTLAQGGYTAIVSGVSGTTGVGLVEVFEVDRPDVPLINISTRGKVGTGDNVMIGGFVVGGNGPRTVVITAKGPTLAGYGVPGTLGDPKLTLYRVDGTAIDANDNWGDSPNKQAIINSGFAPPHPLEPALIATLSPGNYTVVVSGVNNATGVVLLEINEN